MPKCNSSSCNSSSRHRGCCSGSIVGASTVWAVSALQQAGGDIRASYSHTLASSTCISPPVKCISSSSSSVSSSSIVGV